MKIIKKCPVCNKTAEIKSEIRMRGMIVTSYLCGHIRARKELQPKDLDITTKDNKKPYKYQLEGAAWGIKNNARVLFADEMGVGKTIQALLIAHSDQQEFLPILVICKSSLKVQWMKEAFRWCGWIFQILESEDDFILPNVQGYIISYDTLTFSTYTTKAGKLVEKGIKNPEKWISKISPRTIVLDECQSIKNVEAKRTRAVQIVSKHSEHLLALSGTPILNNAAEYFPILNLLQPERFPNKAAYIARWCDSYFNHKSGTQKVGGIRDVEGFKNFTKDFIIRRTRAEVLPDLPSIDRRFRFEELGAKVEEAYKAAFKEFQDFYYYGSKGQTAFQKDGNILAYLSKMRHLTGIAKIPGVVEFAQEFIETTDRKLVIFTHHIDVAKEVVHRLNELNSASRDLHCGPGSFPRSPLWTGFLFGNPEKIIYAPSPVDPNLVAKFWELQSRILVCNTSSMGEGHNLQVCSDCVIMEREWNPPKEEQAEGRFPRPGQTSDKITATYFTAIGTVDEFFAEIVEQKRSIFDSTMNGIKTNWNESSLIKELAEVLAQKGGKKWGF